MSSNIIKSNKLLKDTAANLLAAGRDAISAGLTWLFWLVATHPSVEAKILEDVRLNLINHLVGFIPNQICLYFSN